ncbi:MAG: methyltransferase domain-containing protein [Chloroflexi bacterium]|nr:methyltransferase domain-containing protein [Chloroflexota bacterium]
MDDPERVRESVRAHYAAAARTVLQGARASCCGGPVAGATLVLDDPRFGPTRYEADELAALPADAVSASLGCGNPLLLADLRPGETVLDLGSGGGIDVLLAARRVGPGGRAIGLDMTAEMVALARRSAAAAGVANADFLVGTMEAMPLAEASVDVVTSNCVVNLSPAKERAFAEVARVLRPGGRLAISDVVADDRLTPADRAARGSHESCIAGALSFGEFAAGLAAAGLGDIEILPTHAVADGLFGAMILAVKPLEGSAVPDPARAVKVAAAACAAARLLPPAGELLPLGGGECGQDCCCG